MSLLANTLFLHLIQAGNLEEKNKASANGSGATEPGGYLQWVEYDPTSFRVVSPDQSLKQSANEKHIELIRGPHGSTVE